MNKFDEHLDLMLSGYLDRHPGDIEIAKTKGLIFPTRNKKYHVWVMAHEEHNLIEVSLDDGEASCITQYIHIGEDERLNNQTIHNLFVYLNNYIALQGGEHQICRIT